MANFVPTWYALSGLATYGLNHETGEVARRSYVLYEGKYRNTEKIGEWKLLGKLTEEQLKEVKEILQRGNCPDGTVEYFLVLNGSLVPSVSTDGTPITILAKGEEWEAEARQKWLASVDAQAKRRKEAETFAVRMEDAAKEWRIQNPNACGGQLDYRLQMQAQDVRHLGTITEKARQVALEVGVQ